VRAASRRVGQRPAALRAASLPRRVSPPGACGSARARRPSRRPRTCRSAAGRCRAQRDVADRDDCSLPSNSPPPLDRRWIPRLITATNLCAGCAARSLRRRLTSVPAAQPRKRWVKRSRKCVRIPPRYLGDVQMRAAGVQNRWGLMGEWHRGAGLSSARPRSGRARDASGVRRLPEPGS
jgi:hypothetical protein